MLILHSKIKGLQQLLGISYKDAAHRLYMAELERLKMADSASQSFIMLKNRIDQVVTHELAPIINAVDKWVLDDFVLEDGLWSTK